MGLRFLHLADLDLGGRHNYLGDAAEDREREVLETFRDAISFALDPDHRIDGVLIAGNLFDRHRPDPEIWGFVRGLLGRLTAARKPVLIIPGCRDGFGYKDSVYRTERLPGADLITDASPSPRKIEVGDQDVYFYGMATQPGLTESPFPGFSRTEEEGLHIGILNGAIPDHAEWDFRPHDQIIEPEILSESGLDYIALGGYHGQTILDLEGTTAAYPGTLEGRDFRSGDLGRKSLMVVEVEPGHATIETHPISRKSLEACTIDLSAEGITDTEGLVCALLGRADAKSITRVSLAGSPEFLCDFDEVIGRVSDKFHHLEMVDETDLLGSGLIRRIEREHTIRGFFVRRLLHRIEDLTRRLEDGGADSGLERELAVSRKALKVGLEQFLEEEPTGELLYEAPPARPAARQAPQVAAAPPELEMEPVAVAHANGNGKSKADDPAKARASALIRNEREQALAEGEEGA